jgi:ornithine cyclodeaminase/alanine dehydrogenase-like protein (mu-crystallin family)
VLILNNDEIASVLDMPSTISALRQGYRDLADGRGAHIPLVYLYLPTGRSEDYYRSGTTSGGTMSSAVVAVRIKSDVVSWSEHREGKYCIEPGTYCGLILLYSIKTGEPLAIVTDGYLQQFRLGGMIGLSTDILASKTASVLGVVGSGGMARTGVLGIASVRNLAEIRVYSPTERNRDLFAAEMSDRLGLPVRAVPDSESAVTDADIVLSATDSRRPTLSPLWLKDGAHVCFISRREVDDTLRHRSHILCQLETAAYEDSSLLAGMSWVAGSIPAFVVGDPSDRARVPAGQSPASSRGVPLTEILSDPTRGRTGDEQVTAIILDGTQGIQFAAVAAHAFSLACDAGVGTTVPTSWFLENIRD